ncbi:MAG: polyribonucleotide nucleotidyltransferase [Deltaproteobacteria bacterium]|nr:MAG: polyribonucleotide nucleotidyltransferase [Deltaproteobacteria bacterium]
MSVSAKVGNQSISLETGRVAKQADGSVVVRSGDSMVLVTAVSAKEPKPGFDFFPLTVDYQERLSAAGRIPGSFFRREGRLTERETLISRLIDRSLRPLFPEGYQNDTQVIATVFSADPAYDTDVLALTGASFAMAVSDVPFPFQFAGVRVGRVNGQFVANPGEEERNQSDIDVIMAANRESIFMVEGGGKEVGESDMIEALLFGQRAIEPLLKAQEQIAGSVKAEKRGFDKVPLADGVAARVRDWALEKVRGAYTQHDKHDRYGQLAQIKKDLVAELCAEGQPFFGKEKDVKTALEDLKYDHMRRMIAHEGQRIGGRDTRTVRKISCEVGILPRAHGSALFTRGETQGLVTTTLGTSEDEQRMESLKGQSFRKFMLHYNFPPYSVGEVKPLRGAGRREIGDVHAPVGPGEDLHERAELHDSPHGAEVGLSHLRLLGERADHLDRLLHALAVGRGDGYRAVVLDVDGGSGARDDVWATWTSRCAAPRRASPPSRWTSRSPAWTSRSSPARSTRRARAACTSSPRWPRPSRSRARTSPSTRRRSPPSASRSVASRT